MDENFCIIEQKINGGLIVSVTKGKDIEEIWNRIKEDIDDQNNVIILNKIQLNNLKGVNFNAS